MPYFILKRPNVDAETSIMLYLSLSGIRVKLYTRKKIHPDHWVKELQRASEDLKDFLHGRQINMELKRLGIIANDILNTLQITEGKMTVEQFKDTFESRAFKNIDLKKKTSKSGKDIVAKWSKVKPTKKKICSPFFLHYGEFMEKAQISIGRRRHYAVVYRMLQRYELYTEMVSGIP